MLPLYKNIADAEDILQEGFIKVFTRLHQYKFNGELGAAMNYVRLNSKVFELNGPSFTKDIDAIVLQAEPKSLCSYSNYKKNNRLIEWR